MLKRLAHLAGALALLAATTFGGDAYLSGCDCSNACPLAKAANQRLATGNEAVVVSETLRQEFVRAVLANLEAI